MQYKSILLFYFIYLILSFPRYFLEIKQIKKMFRNFWTWTIYERTNQEGVPAKFFLPAKKSEGEKKSRWTL